MAESKRQPIPLEALFEQEAFGSLPLRLSARLAAGSAPLADLRAIEAGSLVHLETPVGEPSYLTAEGAVIGRGEIVEIRGQLAFRITRLGSRE